MTKKTIYMKFLQIAIAFFLISNLSLYAQDPNILWQKSYYETSNYERLEEIFQTSDMGYIMGGNKVFYSGGEDYDMRVTKIDAQGEIIWEHQYGGLEYLYDIKHTSDNGYIFGGQKVINENWITSYQVYKITENGNLQWNKTIGGDSWDVLFSLAQTNEGGYILGGYSYSNISGDKTENSQGQADYWVIKINSVGNIEWQNTIGGAGIDILKTVLQTSDNGYIVAGTSNSSITGDKTENSRGQEDYWILKLDTVGNILWQKTIGGNKKDDLSTMIITNDGGYLLTGSSKSNISGDKNEDCEGIDDFWIVKLNANGEIEWQNTIGGSDIDISTSIIQTSDNGYLVGGYSKSNISGKKTENSMGMEDYWIIKLNNDGSIAWQNTIGGDNTDVLSSVSENTDGSLVLGGSSKSGMTGDKTVGEASISESYWVINHSEILDIKDFSSQNKLTIYPNPFQSELNIETESFIETFKIYDINGRLINEFKNIKNPEILDLSRLDRGLYFAEFSNSSNITIKKVIKE